MREVSFERPARADASRLLQRAEKWLTANGYEVSARSAFELSLVGAGTGGRHRLTVRADGQTARFVFAPGAPGVALPEQAELERRVDSALQGMASAPAPAAATSEGRRCAICATVLARDETHCPTCGMAAN